MASFLHFNIEPSLLDRVDAFQHSRRMRSRAEAIRELLEYALAVIRYQEEEAKAKQ